MNKLLKMDKDYTEVHDTPPICNLRPCLLQPKNKSTPIVCDVYFINDLRSIQSTLEQHTKILTEFFFSTASDT